MKVSIIIPVYNVAPYIKRCLDSVAAQTYTGDMECILVDDCGTDDSIQIAREWISQLQSPIHFHIIVHQTNKGISAARNTGISVAQGDYVYFMDSDDAITPDCIETLVGLAVKYPDADFVMGNSVKGGNELVPHHFRIEVQEYVDNREQVDFTLLSATIDTAWNRLIKKPFLLRHNLLFPVGIVHEDVYWLFFLTRHTQKAAFTNYGTYYYFRNEESIMHSKTAMSKRVHSYRIIIDALYKEMRLHGSTSKYQCQYFANTFICYMLLLSSFRSLSQWEDFWIHLIQMAWGGRKKVTIYRTLFFLCAMPPQCFLTAFNWWRWRVRNYIIAKI